jgi:predicted TIM-barrel fold metal-dependent hydrolase
MAEQTPPFVIDAHTHAFPPAWVADRAPLVARERWFGDLYGPPTAKMIDAAALLRAMDDAGVAAAVMCGWPWADLALCREHNDFMADAARASGGRLAWLGTVAPAWPGAAAEVERCLALGAAGIGELNADAQGFDLTETGTLTDLAAILIAADRPLLLHASEPVGHDYLGKGSATPDRLLTFLAENPELSVVLAHWGGGLPFYELMPEVAALTRNVVYDTAASSYLYRPAVFRTVLDTIGAERVLWASDHPVLDMEKFLRRTRRAAGIRPEELGPVMSGNARRVYWIADPNAGALETGIRMQT